ncbi:MAG: DUF1289 domain-containing protein [Rhodobacteraceae bacterium]|nr:DUF1289 domain-containing protein [Paracoccaceae bacterium]
MTTDSQPPFPGGEFPGGETPEPEGPWRRDEIDSPCIQICMIHPGARICVGCYRTGDEIAAWSRLSPDERASVRAELPGRADRLRDASARPSRRRNAASARRRAPENGELG